MNYFKKGKVVVVSSFECFTFSRLELFYFTRARLHERKGEVNSSRSEISRRRETIRVCKTMRNL